MYVLDTSAVKAIGRTKVAERLGVHDIQLSPVSFYELLCHLERDAAKNDFGRAKGHVLKCRDIPKLHDPLAYHALVVGAKALTNPTRFEEREVLPQLIRLLDESASLEDFYGRSFKYATGDCASCKDCSSRAEQVLREMEDSYIRHLGELESDIRENYPSAMSRGLTPTELFDIAGASLSALFTAYRDEDGLPEESGLATKVFSATYLHLAYKAHRVVTAIARGAAPDRNDFEDAELLLYIDPLRRDTLVTNDKGTLDAVEAARVAFAQGFANQITFLARAVDCDTFIRETSPKSDYEDPVDEAG